MENIQRTGEGVEYEGRRQRTGEDVPMQPADPAYEGRRTAYIEDNESSYSTHDVVSNASTLANDIAMFATYSKQTIENLEAVNAQLRAELNVALADKQAMELRIGEMLSGLAGANDRIRGFDSFSAELKTLLEDYSQELNIMELAH